jgi:hypothetical protein
VPGIFDKPLEAFAPFWGGHFTSEKNSDMVAGEVLLTPTAIEEVKAFRNGEINVR